MHPPGTIRSAPHAVRKAVPDARAMTVTAVLTWPGEDAAGDVVSPAGLDFAAHRADPWNDLEHNGERVGWARPTLAGGGGAYGVRWLDLEGGGRLPVGTTWFDPSDRLQSQVFALCERDALPGVSLEFRPIPGLFKSRGFASRLPRPWPEDACEFSRVSVLRWSHCARPVNEGALTVTKSQAAADPLLSILSAGRVGGEQLHPTITKSLSQYHPKRRALVRVEKAMADETTAYDDEAPEVASPEPEADAGGATPTAQAAYDAGQMLSDACEQIEQALSKSEHVAGRKKLTALCDQLRKISEKAVAIGDQVAADVGGDGDMDEDDDEPEVPAEDMAADADGVLKAFSRTVRKAYRPNLKRFTTAEIQKAQAEADRRPTREEQDAQRELKKFKRAMRRG
jgi:hypothetical protein